MSGTHTTYGNRGTRLRARPSKPLETRKQLEQGVRQLQGSLAMLDGELARVSDMTILQFLKWRSQIRKYRKQK